MKKLLLCGILGILSQQLIAEPILKVININQELEMENENGKQQKESHGQTDYFCLADLHSRTWV